MIKNLPTLRDILKLFRYTIVLFICFGSLQVGAAESTKATVRYPFDNPAQTAQFHGLLKSLRCLVCQNEDLADSNADLANDLRNHVYDMVKNGVSDTDIMTYLTHRYGDFILFKPPVRALTWLLWFGPGLFLAFGCVCFWWIILRRR